VRIYRRDGAFCFMEVDPNELNWDVDDKGKIYTLEVGEISESDPDPLRVRQRVELALDAGRTPEAFILIDAMAKNSWAARVELITSHRPMRIQDGLACISFIFALATDKNSERWALIDQFGLRNEGGKSEDHFEKQCSMERFRYNAVTLQLESISFDTLSADLDSAKIRGIRRIDTLDDVPSINTLIPIEVAA